MLQNLKWILVGFISGLIVFISSEQAKASAWALAPGEAQLIMTTALSDANTLTNSDGDNIALTNFSKTDSRLYFEMGLMKSIMFVAQTGVQTINFQGAGSDVDFNDFDETKLGLQYEFRRSEGEAGSFLASYVIDGSLDDPRLNLGGRNDEIELRALYGRSKKMQEDEPLKWAWFADVQLATRYDLKTDIVSRWQLDTTLGIKPNEKWMLLSQLYVMDIKSQQIAQFETPGVKQAKAELSFAYRIRPKRFAQIGLTQTFAGRNIVKERGVFFALWQKF